MRRNEPGYTVDGFARRLAAMERQIADLQRVRNPPPIPPAPEPTPLPFHWPGALADHVDVRNGPGEFGADGTIRMIRYRWDTVASTSTTVEWELDGVLAFTHTLPASTDPHVELPAEAYAQEAITAIVTAAGTGGVGLSAFVYFR